MEKYIFVFLLFINASGPLIAQPVSAIDSAGLRRPYQLKLAVDIPVTAAAAAWTFYGFAQTSKHDGTSMATLQTLKRADVNGFDRWAIKAYNSSANSISYIPFYAAMVYPLAFAALDGKMRKDFLELAFMYVEAMGITGALYGSATHYVQRYRPLVYDAASPLDERLSPNSRKSFFAGHVALVGTSAFFVAEVYAQYHPGSSSKWILYTSAGVVTALTGYLRMEAGKHFPSDVLVGTAVGTLTGLLVPKFHRTRVGNTGRLAIVPFTGQASGLTAFYKL